MIIRKVKFKANQTNPVDTWILWHVKIGEVYFVYCENPQCSISGKSTIDKNLAQERFDKSFDELKKDLRNIYGDLTITDETI
jgi:hypothetical protein